MPVDLRPGLEGLVDGLPPEVLYAAFLADLDRRISPARVRGADDELLGWLGSERVRLEADAAVWQSGRTLLGELGLDR